MSGPLCYNSTMTRKEALKLADDQLMAMLRSGHVHEALDREGIKADAAQIVLAAMRIREEMADEILKNAQHVE
jgi:hypothetical protein